MRKTKAPLRIVCGVPKRRTKTYWRPADDLRETCGNVTIDPRETCGNVTIDPR